MTRQTIGRWLFRNAGWRLLSIALAAIIWMNVATEPEMSTLISVPVQFKDPPDGIEVTTRAAETVQLEARGSSGQLRDLTNRRPAVTLDFSGVRDPGDRTFTIARPQTNLPRGVDLVRASPAQIRFHFERSEHRRVPVTVHFEGSLPDGMHLESFRVEPATQEIAGPETHVRKIREASTDTVELSTVNPKRPIAETDLYLPDPLVRFVSQPRVTVTMVLK